MKQCNEWTYSYSLSSIGTGCKFVEFSFPGLFEVVSCESVKQPGSRNAQNKILDRYIFMEQVLNGPRRMFSSFKRSLYIIVWGFQAQVWHAKEYFVLNDSKKVCLNLQPFHGDTDVAI